MSYVPYRIMNCKQDTTNAETLSRDFQKKSQLIFVKNKGSKELTAETTVMRYTNLSFNPRRERAMPCPYRVS